MTMRLDVFLLMAFAAGYVIISVTNLHADGLTGLLNKDVFRSADLAMYDEKEAMHAGRK